MTNQEAATLLIDLYSAYRSRARQDREFEEAVSKAIYALSAMDMATTLVDEKLL